MKELLGGGRFTRIENTFRKRCALGLEVAGQDGVRLDAFCSEDSEPEFCRIACGSGEGQIRCRADRVEKIRTSAGTGEPDVTACHAGITVGCVPLMDGGELLGGAFFGRCLAEPMAETATDDIVRQGGRRGVDEDLLSAAVGTLQRMGDGKLQAAADVLYDLLYEEMGLDAEVIGWRRERTRRQRHIERLIERQREEGVRPEYPLASERELMGKVKIADRVGTKGILDAILSAVLVRGEQDLKVRVLELLGQLSRSAIEGGADENLMLAKNAGYVEKVLGVDDRWDVCGWLGRALDDYIEQVCSSQDASKVTQVRPAAGYIEANYGKAVTLADVANASHLSVSRLAHVFKQQMGVTVIEYLTHVRIERAKELLLATEQNCTEICFAVGYNNQSYFTRTFKNLVGVTPSQFRSRNRRRK